LGRSYEVNGNSTGKYEEIIQQEIEESSRTKGWGQCVTGEQKYPFKQTFKEVGPKKIWTL